MRFDGSETASYLTIRCCLKLPKSAGVMITVRGPRVRNPNSYHHGTGMLQTLSSIEMATVIVTISARKMVRHGEFARRYNHRWRLL